MNSPRIQLCLKNKISFYLLPVDEVIRRNVAFPEKENRSSQRTEGFYEQNDKGLFRSKQSLPGPLLKAKNSSVKVFAETVNSGGLKKRTVVSVS